MGRYQKDVSSSMQAVKSSETQSMKRGFFGKYIHVHVILQI